MIEASDSSTRWKSKVNANAFGSAGDDHHMPSSCRNFFLRYAFIESQAVRESMDVKFCFWKKRKNNVLFYKTKIETQMSEERERERSVAQAETLLRKIRRSLSEVVATWHCGQACLSWRYFSQHSSQLMCQQTSDTHGLTHDSY